MLSFIMRLVFEFEKNHGYQPNLLYLSHEHLQRLRQELKRDTDIQTIAQKLGMEIIVTQDAVHPHVARIQIAEDIKAAS
jgi:hypothetical protein